MSVNTNASHLYAGPQGTIGQKRKRNATDRELSKDVTTTDENHRQRRGGKRHSADEVNSDTSRDKVTEKKRRKKDDDQAEQIPISEEKHGKMEKARRRKEDGKGSQDTIKEAERFSKEEREREELKESDKVFDIGIRSDEDALRLSTREGKRNRGEDKLKDPTEHTIIAKGTPEDGKKKKRRRSKDATDANPADVTTTDDRHTTKKKKKRSKDTSTGLVVTEQAQSFPDPDADTGLNDQARKALEYAYVQVHDRSAWKFNKARQNWIIRNIWSAQNIPERHWPLTLRYLKDVKGGVREALIQECRKTISLVSTEAATSPPTDQPQTAEELKKIRATALLGDLTSLIDS